MFADVVQTSTAAETSGQAHPATSLARPIFLHGVPCHFRLYGFGAGYVFPGKKGARIHGSFEVASTSVLLPLSRACEKIWESIGPGIDKYGTMTLSRLASTPPKPKLGIVTMNWKLSGHFDKYMDGLALATLEEPFVVFIQRRFLRF